MIQIEIDPESDIPHSIRPEKIKKILELIFSDYKKEVDAVSVIVVNDEYLRDLHRDFLNDDTPTDVMAFDLSESGKLSGEIYVSAERAEAQAEELGFSTSEELNRYMIHGALHLCGFDDKDPGGREEMRRLEDKYLKLLEKEII